jgi:excisionase family DNA binding protein
MSREPDLTVQQAADELQVCPKTVRTLCASGTIRSYRAGKGGRTSPIRIRRRDLDRYKDAQPTPNQ